MHEFLQTEEKVKSRIAKGMDRWLTEEIQMGNKHLRES